MPTRKATIINNDLVINRQVMTPFRASDPVVCPELNADLWDGYQFIDYLNQDVKTTASPTFAKITAGVALIGGATDDTTSKLQIYAEPSKNGISFTMPTMTDNQTVYGTKFTGNVGSGMATARTVYGVYNDMNAGALNANLYGVYNKFNITAVNANSYGIWNEFTASTGASNMVGIYGNYTLNSAANHTGYVHRCVQTTTSSPSSIGFNSQGVTAGGGSYSGFVDSTVINCLGSSFYTIASGSATATNVYGFRSDQTVSTVSTNSLYPFCYNNFVDSTTAGQLQGLSLVTYVAVKHTLNDPTTDKIGVFVDWDCVSSTDVNNKAWAFYNNSVTAASGKVFLGADNIKTFFGTGLDLSIYHNGTDTFIENTTGKLTLKDTNATGILIGTAATQKVGFYNATPIVQPSAYTQTYATASKTHPNATSTNLATGVSRVAGDGVTWGFTSQAATDNIATQVNAMQADLIDLKKVVNQLIDDLQVLGLVA
jgi:hypothetical protein